ncbi:Hypothetical protein NTJ_02287 [Nesidiocoris tenuis]|uniref:Uncharacterized protein n=1 Tax=Nesidiocoris tenuis TaxID=355587 RepID=A0ABN7AB30_9HEMI|nr:Hypothetical protein NTJ_02287 [Nesidiocoris tenuis]
MNELNPEQSQKDDEGPSTTATTTEGSGTKRMTFGERTKSTIQSRNATDEELTYTGSSTTPTYDSENDEEGNDDESVDETRWPAGKQSEPADESIRTRSQARRPDLGKSRIPHAM